MKIAQWIEAIREDRLNETLTFLYGEANVEAQKERYINILEKAEKKLPDSDVRLFTAPGRTEIGGNHTDHQLGRVLAASIQLDVLAVVTPLDIPVITYLADAFTVKPVDISNLSFQTEEINTTEALIRGICARFVQLGYKVGGFKCYAESDVLPGSGMSSSAAFEILIAEILSDLYNKRAVPPIEMAKIGQYAENVFFGKASGLMDQMACSVGGFVLIDFANKERPEIRSIPFELDQHGYSLILTDCRQSHADLSEEYSLVPAEMKAAAAAMGKNVLSECTLDMLFDNARYIREKCGDRAFLRAYHFMNETERVPQQAKALDEEDIQTFLRLIRESGRSSFMYLQNVYPPNDNIHQSLATGLAVSEHLLSKDGAWRVHGGGFAGTIQAFVPNDQADAYIERMESVFGSNSCYRLRIRSVGGYEIRGTVK